MKFGSLVFFRRDYLVIPAVASFIVLAAGWLVADRIYADDCSTQAKALLDVAQERCIEQRVEDLRRSAEHLTELRSKAVRLTDAIAEAGGGLTPEEFQQICRRLNIESACVRKESAVVLGWRCRTKHHHAAKAHRAVEFTPELAYLAENESQGLLEATVARRDARGHVTIFEEMPPSAKHILPRDFRGIFSDSAYLVRHDVIEDAVSAEWRGEALAVHPVLSKVGASPEGAVINDASGEMLRWWQRRVRGDRIVLLAPKHAGFFVLLPELGAAVAVFAVLFCLLVASRRRSSLRHRDELVAVYSDDNAMSRLYCGSALITPEKDEIRWLKHCDALEGFFSDDAPAADVLAAIEENFVGNNSRKAFRAFLDWKTLRQQLTTRTALDLTIEDKNGRRWVVYLVWSERDLSERPTSYLLLLQKVKTADGAPAGGIARKGAGE